MPHAPRVAALAAMATAAMTTAAASAASAHSASAASAAAPPVDLARMVSATHWQPCYYMNASAPCLHDGAATLAATGTRAIKVIMDAAPDKAYPWNTDWTPILAPVRSLEDLARTELYDELFAGRPGPGGWDYDVFDVVTYRYGANSGGPSEWNYWCRYFTPADAAGETAEFSGLTAHLLTRFAGSGKRFLLEHWEGDWSARCGGYNASQVPDPAVQARMVRWLGARQAGVEAGRSAWCAAAVAAGRLPAGFDCAHGGAVHAAAGVEVLHASEVNLVKASMDAGFPNNILEVIPRVRLDMVSYSSYDTQALNPGFGHALDFIAAHHNRTAASPPSAVWVAEYGVAQNSATPAEVTAVYANVNGWAASLNAAGVPRAAHTFAWELFDNEVIAPGFPGQRCTPSTGPEFNASALNGFWLVRPDGSLSPSWDFVAGLINGSVPVPVPPPSGKCTFTPDTDVSGADGYAVDAATREACCTTCSTDVRCAAGVFVPADKQCWLKFASGTPVAKKGVTMCVPDRAAAAAAADAAPAAAPRNSRLRPRSGAVVHGGGSGGADFGPYAAVMGAHAPMGFMTYLGLADLNGTAPGAVNKWFTELNATLCQFAAAGGAASCDDWLLVPQIGLSLPHDGKEAKVAAGEYDNAIAALTAGLAWLNRPVYLRIGYECNGVGWNNYKPASYIGAWKRVVDALRASPAGNATAAVWDITCDDVNKHMDWYPGDDAVDWWGVNIYSGHSAPGDTDCVKPFMEAAAAGGFPVMFGEVAPRGKLTNVSATWAEWFAPYFDTLLGGYAGAAAFVSYIDRDWNAHGNYKGWGDSRVETPGAVAAGVAAQYTAQMANTSFGWLHRSSRAAVAAALGLPPDAPAATGVAPRGLQ
jgi:hypothetical protein